MEESADRGEIGAYGCATWNGLRVPPDNAGHLSLEELVSLAREIAGDGHHFRAVQLPVNLAMPEAIRTPSQRLGGQLVPAITAATELGLTVLGSASLMQGKLAANLPGAVAPLFPECRTDAQRAIEFVRAMPGVTAALFGARQADHIDDCLGCAERRRAN
jgi:aryl-alcohol dehydrogenase-like predicted oxidoreductase